MRAHDHLDMLDAYKVIEWDYAKRPALWNPDKHAYALRSDWNTAPPFTQMMTEFSRMPNANKIVGLVVGMWMWGDAHDTSSATIVELLTHLRHVFTNLRALFIGDIASEENEISWIIQSDMTPLLNAYPKLEYFGVRGGTSLELGAIQHESLRTLVVETGGLPSNVVNNLARARLPKLEKLELWIGTDSYGRTVTLDDLRLLLHSTGMPSLRTLALRNSELADETAPLLAAAPLMQQPTLETLDLSMGTLSDAGAQALLENPHVARMRRLHLDHHYMSEEMMRKLEALPLVVTMDDQQEADEDDDRSWRYVQVGE
jgi:hypothetical protein